MGRCVVRERRGGQGFWRCCKSVKDEGLSVTDGKGHTTLDGTGLTKKQKSKWHLSFD